LALFRSLELADTTFGSLGWAHIPKQVRKGKLELRAVKVQLLEWWTDETKGYRLEDMENNKLIASQDVQFFEDSSPSELAIMSIGAPIVSTGSLNSFIDNAINNKANQQDTQQDSELSRNVPDIPTVPSTDCPTTPFHDKSNILLE